MLKFTYDNVEDIPEGLESIYSKDDTTGKYQLQEVEGLVSKSKLNEFRDNNVALRKQIQDSSDEHDKFKLDTEEERLKNNKDYDGLTAHLTDKHQKEMADLIEKHKSEIDPLSTQVQKLTVDSVIDNFADKHVKPGLGRGFKGEIKEMVTDLDGNPVVGGVPLGEYLKEGAYKNSDFDAYLLAPEMSGAGSQHSSTHTPNSNNKKLTAEEKVILGLSQ